MGNGKNKIFGIVLISTIILTSGCGITITRNQFFGNQDKIEKSSAKKENDNHNQADALKNMKNEQNR